MEDRGIFKGCGFWVLALLWLPAGVVAQALVRFMPETGTQADAGLSAAMLPMLAGSLVLVVPCGLPLALGCRRVWRLGDPADPLPDIGRAVLRVRGRLRPSLSFAHLALEARGEAVRLRCPCSFFARMPCSFFARASE